MDDKPRPKAPTLVGIGPPGAAVVVGAVGKLELTSPHSVETQRMIFEPGHEPKPVPGAESSTMTALTGETEPVPPPTPSPPPASAEPVETPALPPVAPVSEPFELARPPLRTQPSVLAEEPPVGPTRRSPLRAMAVAGALLLIAVVAAAAVLRHGVKRSYANASSAQAAIVTPIAEASTSTTTTTTTPTPTPTPTTATATATASTPTPTTATASTPTPTPTSTPTPLAVFNSYAARLALDATSHEVAKCRRGKAFGIALATVTFANDGSVSERVVSPPFAGTPTGACVADALGEAHVAPFLGKPGVMVYKFYVAQK